MNWSRAGTRFVVFFVIDFESMINLVSIARIGFVSSARR